MGTSSCTRTEFNNAAGNAAQSIEFVQLDTTFANIAQTVRTLKEVDGKYDAVALVRGGGSGLEVFNNNDLLGTIVRMKSAVISAVGHAEEKHNLKLLADLSSTLRQVWVSFSLTSRNPSLPKRQNPRLLWSQKYANSLPNKLRHRIRPMQNYRSN